MLPKVVLGVRSAFNYAGGVSLGFAAAFGSRLRKLADNSRIWRKISSHSECSPYILNSIGSYSCLLIDRKENIPIDAMRGERKKSSNSFAIVLQRTEETDIKGWGRCLVCGGRQNTMLRASHHRGRSIRSKIFVLQRRACDSFAKPSSME